MELFVFCFVRFDEKLKGSFQSEELCEIKS